MRVLRNLIASLVLISLLLALAPTRRASAGTIRRVRAGASGANNGTSWTNAYRSLQSALSAAAFGDEIWVAKGTYKPTTGTNRAISFQLKDGVAIYGGFAGTETDRSQRKPSVNVTILSGDIGTAGSVADDSFHVARAINLTDKAILDGFTITGGWATGGTSDDNGGGLYNATDNGSGNPTLQNLVITDNFAQNGGGGIFNDQGAPLMSNVTFSSNSAGQSGGGLYVSFGIAKLTNAVFSSNSAQNEALNTFGGAVFTQGSTVTMKKVTFTNNIATSTVTTKGGALYADDSTVSLANATFSGNSASFGGAVYNFNTSTTTITNAIFTANRAPKGGAIYNDNGATIALSNVTANANRAQVASGGGGFLYNFNASTATLTNSTLFGNSTAGAGGALFNDDVGVLTLRNVTMTGDTASKGGNEIFLNGNFGVFSGFNSILWSTGGGISSTGGTQTLTDSIVAGSCPANVSCIHVTNGDPKLGLLRSNGGFGRTMALSAGSSAIDAGGTDVGCTARDQRGVPRADQGLACDIGAYEVKAKLLISRALYDGYITESSASSGIGGATNSTSLTFRVGDDATNRRYRGIVSFDTTVLPTHVTFVRAVLVAQRFATTGNPSGTLGSITVDVASPWFGGQPGLISSDFQAIPSAPGVASMVPVPGGNLYAATLNATDTTFGFVTGTNNVQFRLRFTNAQNNGAADYFSFISSNIFGPGEPLLWVYFNPN